jgi:hypothetical protein
MNSPFVPLPIICGCGIGFPVQVTGLVKGTIEIQIKMATLEGAFRHQLVAVEGAVARIIMQNELVDVLNQFCKR